MPSKNPIQDLDSLQKKQTPTATTSTATGTFHPATAWQRLTPRSVLQLQRVVGNRAVTRLLQRTQGMEDEQRSATGAVARGGLPDNLRTGIETLSGMDMSDVRVHRNSSDAAKVNALAYAQGSDIHIAPGQEQHLPHEAWHVVQQRQGRVQPTGTVPDGRALNDDPGLEAEADRMGSRALQTAAVQRVEEEEPMQAKVAPLQRMEEEEPMQQKADPLQRMEGEEEEMEG
jgi:hypothetical protein